MREKILIYLGINQKSLFLNSLNKVYHLVNYCLIYRLSLKELIFT
jgi:hypothetical protein